MDGIRRTHIHVFNANDVEIDVHIWRINKNYLFLYTHLWKYFDTAYAYEL